MISTATILNPTQGSCAGKGLDGYEGALLRPCSSDSISLRQEALSDGWQSGGCVTYANRAMCEAHEVLAKKWLIGIRLGMRGRTCGQEASSIAHFLPSVSITQRIIAQRV